MKISVLIPTTGDIATVREHAALADDLGFLGMTKDSNGNRR